jgi:hypothetical protein
VRGLRIGAVVLAVLVFVFLAQPTGAAIVAISAVLLLALAVIEAVAAPETPSPTGGPPAGIASTQATPPATPPVEPIPAGSVPPVPTPAGPPPEESAPAESTGRR